MGITPFPVVFYLVSDTSKEKAISKLNILHMWLSVVICMAETPINVSMVWLHPSLAVEWGGHIIM